MSSKRDSVSQRLKSLLDEEKRRKKAELIFSDFPVGMLAVNPISDRARVLSDAVYLRPEEAALAEAFGYFDLDPHKPEDWHRLINYLSRSHFERKPPGRHLEWTADRYLQLMIDFRLAAQKLSDKKSRSRFRKIRQLMIEDPAFAERYSHMKQDALAKQLENMLVWVNRSISGSTRTA